MRGLCLLEQAPQGDTFELDASERASVELFQRNTPSVVNISNISKEKQTHSWSLAATSKT